MNDLKKAAIERHMSRIHTEQHRVDILSTMPDKLFEMVMPSVTFHKNYYAIGLCMEVENEQRRDFSMMLELMDIFPPHPMGYARVDNWDYVGPVESDGDDLYYLMFQQWKTGERAEAELVTPLTMTMRKYPTHCKTEIRWWSMFHGQLVELYFDLNDDIGTFTRVQADENDKRSVYWETTPAVTPDWRIQRKGYWVSDKMYEVEHLYWWWNLYEWREMFAKDDVSGENE